MNNMFFTVHYWGVHTLPTFEKSLTFDISGEGLYIGYPEEVRQVSGSERQQKIQLWRKLQKVQSWV